MTNNVYTEMIKAIVDMLHVDKYINIFGMLLYFLVALDCFSLKLRVSSDLSKNKEGLEE